MPLAPQSDTPQKPQRVPRERDPEAIAAWLESDWPRIKKKARRQGAHIALIDESGLLMAPLAPPDLGAAGPDPRARPERRATARRSRSRRPCGCRPRRDRLGLYFHTLANGYFDNWYVTAFLEAMLQDLAGRFVVVWDGGPMHKGDPIRDLRSHFADRLGLERLPPCAPMLNPVEPLWSWLKWERLSNFAPQRRDRTRRRGWSPNWRRSERIRRSCGTCSMPRNSRFRVTLLS